MKYVITETEISPNSFQPYPDGYKPIDIVYFDIPTNNPPIVIDFGDCTEDDAIVHAKSELEEIWDREKFDWAISHEWNARDKCGIVKYSDGSWLRVDVVKVIRDIPRF